MGIYSLGNIFKLDYISKQGHMHYRLYKAFWKKFYRLFSHGKIGKQCSAWIISGINSMSCCYYTIKMLGMLTL